MVVKVSKPEINVREKISELDKPSGTAGQAMLAAETPQEQFNLISAGRRNLIINGDMRIAQAGTSITTTGTGSYQACDRWRIQTNKNQTTHTLAQVEDAPEGFNYSLKLTVGVGATSAGTDFGRLYQRLEVQDVWQFGFNTSSPKPFTFSFWVKSSITGTYGGTFSANGTGVYVFSYTVNAANVWEYKTITVNGIKTLGQDTEHNGIGFGVHFDLGEGPGRSHTEGVQPTVNSGSMGLTGGVKILATSGATWQITGVQLEAGKVATPFEHRSYGDELAKCQRYYEKIYLHDTYRLNGVAWSTESQNISLPFTVTKRVPPSISVPSIGQVFTGSWVTPTLAEVTGATINGGTLNIKKTGSYTVKYGYFIRYQDFRIDAEM
jgi:hypothetical protein